MVFVVCAERTVFTRVAYQGINLSKELSTILEEFAEIK